LKDVVVPGFAPGGYGEDADLDKVVVQLEKKTGFMPGHFVKVNHLPIVIGLVSERGHREADREGGGVAACGGGAGARSTRTLIPTRSETAAFPPALPSPK
jgi:hypothetical protein